MFEALSAIVLLAGCGWSAYTVAVWCYPADHGDAPAVVPRSSTERDAPGADEKLTGSVGTSVRLAAAVVVGCWLLVAVFLGLAAIGQFRVGPAIAVWLVIAGALHLRGGRAAAAAARVDL